MPQPVWSVPNLRTNFRYDTFPGVLERKPHLATLIASVLNHWAWLDTLLAWAFAKLMETNIDVGAAIYTSFTGSSAQRAAFGAARDAALDSQDDRDLLEAIMGFVDSVRKRRNAIAHGLWFESEQVPDGFILRLSDHGIQDMIAAARLHSDPNPDYSKLAPPDLRQLMIYKEEDFRSLIADIQKANQFVLTFWAPSRLTAIATAKQRDQLSNEPQLREKLRRLREGRSNTSEDQQSPPSTSGPAPADKPPRKK